MGHAAACATKYEVEASSGGRCFLDPLGVLKPAFADESERIPRDVSHRRVRYEIRSGSEFGRQVLLPLAGCVEARFCGRVRRGGFRAMRPTAACATKYEVEASSGGRCFLHPLGVLKPAFAEESERGFRATCHTAACATKYEVEASSGGRCFLHPLGVLKPTFTEEQERRIPRDVSHRRARY